MPPQKFRTTILNLKPDAIAHAILLAGGKVTHARRLHTEWFFLPADQSSRHPVDTDDLRQWGSLHSDTPRTGHLSMTSTHTPEIGGQREITTTVSSVDDTLRILAHFGHEPRVLLERYRTAYTLGPARLSVDEVPGGYTWLTLEGPDTATVLDIVSILGYRHDQHRPLSTMQAYRCHGIDLLAHDEVTFARPPQPVSP